MTRKVLCSRSRGSRYRCFRSNLSPFTINTRTRILIIHSSTPGQYCTMDKLPDEILLRIFFFLHFTQRIILRPVSRRWSYLLYDQSLLENVSITKLHCEDCQLFALFTASKRLIAVDLFNSRWLDGSCMLHAGLSRLKHLTLSGTGITEQILSKIPKASSELLELHLAQTRISEKCLPEIIGLKKLQYITVPPEDVFGFGRSGVLAIAKSSPSLRTLDCQEGYLFNQEEISQIIHCNWQLSSLIIPYAFVDDSTFTFIIEKLENLTYICMCETSVSQACVNQIKTRKPSLEICWNVNHTP